MLLNLLLLDPPAAGSNRSLQPSHTLSKQRGSSSRGDRNHQSGPGSLVPKMSVSDGNEGAAGEPWHTHTPRSQLWELPTENHFPGVNVLKIKGGGEICICSTNTTVCKLYFSLCMHDLCSYREGFVAQLSAPRGDATCGTEPVSGPSGQHRKQDSRPNLSPLGAAFLFFFSSRLCHFIHLLFLHFVLFLTKIIMLFWDYNNTL